MGNWIDHHTKNVWAAKIVAELFSMQSSIVQCNLFLPLYKLYCLTIFVRKRPWHCVNILHFVLSIVTFLTLHWTEATDFRKMVRFYECFMKKISKERTHITFLLECFIPILVVLRTYHFAHEILLGLTLHKVFRCLDIQRNFDWNFRRTFKTFILIGTQSKIQSTFCSNWMYLVNCDRCDWMNDGNVQNKFGAIFIYQLIDWYWCELCACKI